MSCTHPTPIIIAFHFFLLLFPSSLLNFFIILWLLSGSQISDRVHLASLFLFRGNPHREKFRPTISIWMANYWRCVVAYILRARHVCMCLCVSVWLRWTRPKSAWLCPVTTTCVRRPAIRSALDCKSVALQFDLTCRCLWLSIRQVGRPLPLRPLPLRQLSSIPLLSFSRWDGERIRLLVVVDVFIARLRAAQVLAFTNML